jgi:hypothetical protein
MDARFAGVTFGRPKTDAPQRSLASTTASSLGS